MKHSLSFSHPTPYYLPSPSTPPSPSPTLPATHHLFPPQQPEEDETIWHIPLEVLSVKDNKVDINHDALLSARELELPFKDVKDSIYKLNAETCGVCTFFFRVAGEGLTDVVWYGG